MIIFEIIFKRILEMSAIASIIGIITLMIQKILKRKISPKWLMYIWIVYLLVLINPIPIESQFSIYNKIPFSLIEIEKKETLDQHTNLESINDFQIGIQTINFKEQEISKQTNFIEKIKNRIQKFLNQTNIEYIQLFEMMLIIIYWGTTGMKLSKYSLAQLKLCKHKYEKFQEERLEKLLEKSKKTLSIKRNIELVKQDEISTPAICGIKNPKILLNEKILTLTDEEIELIFIHELAHLKKGDIELNYFLQFLKAIYWFNPILNYMFARIKKDIELVNDEMVLEKIKESQIITYCKTLLKVTQFLNLKSSASLTMGGNAKELEERIKMINRKEKFSKNKLIIVTTVTTLILGITVCFATNPLKNNKTEENYFKEENNILTDKLILSEKEENKKIIVKPLETLIITANYGKRIHPITKEEKVHDGIDFKAEKGEKVMAISDGVIENTGFNTNDGNFIQIKHQNKETEENIYSYYAHLSLIEVEVGDVVEAGMKIGEVGSTGMATGPHLHLSIMNEKMETINPASFFEITK